VLTYTLGRFFVITWQGDPRFNLHSCEACLWRVNLWRYGFGWYRRGA
jgi:hypothetical protein